MAPSPSAPFALARQNILFPPCSVPFGLPDEPAPGLYVMPSERIKGVHLTYLNPDGSGKAPVDPSMRRIRDIVKGSPLALIPPSDSLVHPAGISNSDRRL